MKVRSSAALGVAVALLSMSAAADDAARGQAVKSACMTVANYSQESERKQITRAMFYFDLADRYWNSGAESEVELRALNLERKRRLDALARTCRANLAVLRLGATP